MPQIFKNYNNNILNKAHVQKELKKQELNPIRDEALELVNKTWFGSADKTQNLWKKCKLKNWFENIFQIIKQLMHSVFLQWEYRIYSQLRNGKFKKTKNLKNMMRNWQRKMKKWPRIEKLTKAIWFEERRFCKRRN